MLLITVSSYETHIVTECLRSVHELICICGIYLAFEGHGVWGTYIAITCKAYIAIHCILAHIRKMELHVEDSLEMAIYW